MKKRSIFRRVLAGSYSGNLSTTRIIALTFAAIILLGAILLTLPAASRNGESCGSVYGDFRHLCDRIGAVRYLEPMERLWTDSDPVSDRDRRFGIYVCRVFGGICSAA